MESNTFLIHPGLVSGLDFKNCSKYSLDTCYTLVSALSTSMTLLVSLANSTLSCSPVTDKEAEAQRGGWVCSRSHSEEEAKLEFDSEVSVYEYLTALLSCLHK